MLQSHVSRLQPYVLPLVCCRYVAMIINLSTQLVPNLIVQIALVMALKAWPPVGSRWRIAFGPRRERPISPAGASKGK